MRRPTHTYRLTVCFLLASSAISCDDATSSPGDGGAVDGPPVTRSETILTADRYATAEWTMSEQNRTGVTCGGTFLSGYPVGDRVGVGYKWGDWTDVDDFLAKISMGYATGTGGGLTYETIPFDCVVGVSCTGLVSRAWHLNHKYTLNYADPDIPRKFQEITHTIDGVDIGAGQVSALKKGDALINQYHVMLFVYETPDGIPMIIDSSYEGVRFRPVTWGALAAEGYTAMRYNNIVEDDDPSGTTANPAILELDAHDVSVTGNTRDAVSLEFHRYSPEPESSQSGPEVTYQVVVATRGMLTASLSEVGRDGIDNDLHLLSSLARDDAGTALDCVARDDSLIEIVIESGTWYLVVDSGDGSPGKFELRVAFQPR
jgi:hypothetical protein